MSTRENDLVIAPDATVRPGLSACLIVRDEEPILRECLESLAGCVDEICVVDTGSRDGTRALALSLGARVETFAWADDFSLARNRSLAMARFEWILVIDADESLPKDSGPALRAAILRTDASAFFLTREDLRGDGHSELLPIIRLFRNDPRIRFERPVHESVADSLVTLGCSRPPTIAVRLRHTGYLPAALARTDKSARNVAILRKLVVDRPDDIYARWKFAQTLLRPTELTERIDAYRAAHALAEQLPRGERDQHPFLPRVYDEFASLLADGGELQAAIQVVERGLLAFAGNAELLYRRAEIALRAGDLDRAEALLEALPAAAQLPSLYGRRPELATLWPTLGRARIAFARDLHARGFELLEAALACGFRDVDSKCLWVEQKFALLDFQGGVALFGSLVAEEHRTAQVQILAGDVAWMQRDRKAAGQYWRAACRSSSYEHHALCRIGLATWVTGEGSPADALPALKVRDVASAAAALLLAVAADGDVAFDPGFDLAQVVASTRRWVGGFVRQGRPGLHAELQRLASRREAQFPGLARAVS